MKDLSELSRMSVLKAIRNEIDSAPHGDRTAYAGYYMIRYLHKLKELTPEYIADSLGLRPSYVIEVRKFRKINKLMREEGLL